MSMTDDQIRKELAAFLAGRREWPTYREFQSAGLRSVRDAVTRRGGAPRWAQELGVPFVYHRPGYAPIWTDERIRAELRVYLADRRGWPSRKEFDRDDRTALRNAVNRTGGADRWAHEFGLLRGTRRLGMRRGWTPAVIEAELERFLSGRSTWPSRHEFEEAGLTSLLGAIYWHEGPSYWAARMDVASPAAPVAPARTIWTEERICRQLESFCAGRSQWPTEREFIEAGLGRLYRAASRRGGVRYWADRLGLRRTRQGP